MIRKSDVVIENFRPTTMKKMGLHWEDLKKINPGIIYCSICGFGHDSLPEYAERPSYDMVAQAYSGLMSITGPEGGPPCRVGSSVGDIISGMQATIGILAAMRYREKTGRGQHVDISMIDSLFSTLENAVVRFTIKGEIPGPLGGIHPSITPFQGYKTKDGSYIIAAIGTDALFVRYAKVIGRPELLDDERFKTNPAADEEPQCPQCDPRPDHGLEDDGGVGGDLREGGASLFADQQHEADLRGPAHRLPQDARRDRPAPVGKMHIASSPIRMTETPGEVYAPAPLLGQHTDEVLKALLGYSDETIAQLKKEGIINNSY